MATNEALPAIALITVTSVVLWLYNRAAKGTEVAASAAVRSDDERTKQQQATAIPKTLFRDREKQLPSVVEDKPEHTATSDDRSNLVVIVVVDLVEFRERLVKAG